MELYVTMEGRWGRRGITNERGEKMRRDDKRSALQSRRDFCNVVCTVSVRGSPTANVVISRRERERERERERDLDRSNVERGGGGTMKRNRASGMTIPLTILSAFSFRRTLNDSLGRSLEISTYYFHRSTTHRRPFISRTRQTRKKRAQDACADG